MAEHLRLPPKKFITAGVFTRHSDQPKLKSRRVKTFLAVLGVAFALAIAGGVVWFVNDARNQVAIVKVFSEQSKAANQFQAELHMGKVKKGPADIQQALKHYARALQSIDYSSCPKKFRLAWFDYVAAVVDLSDKNLAASSVKDLLELGMSVYTKDGRLAEDAVQDTDSFKRPAILLHRCQRIAISYGVSFSSPANRQ